MNDLSLTKIESKRLLQRQKLVLLAQQAIAENGLQNLKARDLASALGVSIGSIYNLVSDLDEIILLVASHTLERLEAAIINSLKGQDKSAPQDRLVLVAQTYHHFARTNYHLWDSLFDPRFNNKENLPQWVTSDRMRPFKFVETPLAELMVSADHNDIALFAQTVFSAVHGLIRLGLDSRDVGVREDQLDGQIEKLIRLIVIGLQNDNL